MPRPCWTITSLTQLVAETAAWQWDDVPGRVLFTRADHPPIPHSVPRFIPDHELVALMAAVDRLPDPDQRAALIVAQWIGARRDEIRRLTLDCLDSYPRLRLAIDKGHSERMIPLHPDAATALQPLIERTRTQKPRPRYDPDAEHDVVYIFSRRGQLTRVARCSGPYGGA